MGSGGHVDGPQDCVFIFKHVTIMKSRLKSLKNCFLPAAEVQEPSGVKRLLFLKSAGWPERSHLDRLKITTAGVDTDSIAHYAHRVSLDR